MIPQLTQPRSADGELQVSTFWPWPTRTRELQVFAAKTELRTDGAVKTEKNRALSTFLPLSLTKIWLAKLEAEHHWGDMCTREASDQWALIEWRYEKVSNVWVLIFSLEYPTVTLAWPNFTQAISDCEQSPVPNTVNGFYVKGYRAFGSFLCSNSLTTTFPSMFIDLQVRG